MRAINWPKLISEASDYAKFRDEVDDLTKRKMKFETEIPCMESIFSLCTSKDFQRIFNSYMFFPADITGKNYTKLARDMEKAKEDFEVCKKQLKKANLQMVRKRYNIHHILVDIMDEDMKKYCIEFYCPQELITSENIPALKTIITIAREDAPTMYGEGGFAYGDSVIGALFAQVKKFKAYSEV